MTSVTKNNDVLSQLLMYFRGITNGKCDVSDVAHAYNYQKMVLIDFSHTQADKIDHIRDIQKRTPLPSQVWERLQSVLNPKPCHVVVFTNFGPERHKLSDDRLVYERTLTSNSPKFWFRHYYAQVWNEAFMNQLTKITRDPTDVSWCQQSSRQRPYRG